MVRDAHIIKKGEIIPKTKKFGCVGRGDLTFFFKSCEIYERRLLVKPPLRHKTQKNNTCSRGREAHADKISLLKAFLHKCGRAGISSKQLKKIKQNKRMYATFPESQKNT